MTTGPRSTTLPPTLASVRAGRHFVRDVLLDWQLPQLVDDAQLCTSELVTNAVRHAGTEVVVTVRLDTCVTVAVDDRNPDLSHPVIARAAHPWASGGRGLAIVEAVSSQWGVAPAAAGKCVWFSLAVPDEGADTADLFSLGTKRDDNVRAAAQRESDRAATAALSEQDDGTQRVSR